MVLCIKTAFFNGTFLRSDTFTLMDFFNIFFLILFFILRCFNALFNMQWYHYDVSFFFLHKMHNAARKMQLLIITSIGRVDAFKNIFFNHINIFMKIFESILECFITIFVH